MQSHELVEVAGLIAAHSQSLTRDQPQLPEQALADYWVASRCRLDSWGHDLRTYSVAAKKTGATPFTDRLFRLSVEIETSEVLARTLAALGLAHDHVHACHETAPITTNTLACHRESSVRLDALLAGRDEASFREVVRFRNLRTRLRKLTDQLVGCFLPLAPVTPFAHNARDAMEFGDRSASRVARGGEAADWPTISRAIATLRHECGVIGPNADQSHQVAAAAMGLFAPEMFDSFGLLRTTWLRRLERVGDETTVLVEEWLATEKNSPAKAPVNRLAGTSPVITRMFR